MKNRLKERNGFALVTVLLVLVVISILGISIIGVTTSTFKMAKIDSKSQSAYYIAEAGINYRINEIRNELQTEPKKYQSVEKFEAQFIGESYYDGFQNNMGEDPIAKIEIKSTEAPKEYEIKSTGIIGNTKRTVSSIVLLKLEQPIENNSVNDNIIITKSLNMERGNKVEGNGMTIVVDELIIKGGGRKLLITNIYINGPLKIDYSLGGGYVIGSYSEPGTVYVNGDLFIQGNNQIINGDLRVSGNCDLSDTTINGDLIVAGECKLRNNVKINGDLIVASKLKEDYKNKVTKTITDNAIVETWEIPTGQTKLREPSWYEERKYKIKDSKKIFVKNYNNNTWFESMIDTIIVSEKDINFNTNFGNFKGALIAPNGHINFNQSANNFEGVIISKEGITINQFNKFNLKNLKYMFEKEDDIPVIFSTSNTNNSPDDDLDIENGTGEIELTIIVPIKEL